MGSIIDIAEGATPSTPSSGRLVIFANTDGQLASVNDAGAVVVIAGGPRVYKKAIAFNSANISGSGFPFYTPVVGDVALDIWVEITTAWDGTTPKYDIGTGVGTNDGLFAYGWGVPTPVADIETRETGVLFNPYPSMAGSGASAGSRTGPAKFTATNPLLIWVTQDGQQGGASPGSTVGAGFVYLVVATPITL